MGLRCLIGHEYGEPQTSRDRRQGGNEVVTTVREYRECARCGHRRIISENTEVTAEPLAESADEPAAEAAWAPDADEAGETFPVSDADLGRDPVDAQPGADEPMSAAEDDGVILEDEPAAPHRARGAWPEADLDESIEADDEPEPWPDEDTPAEPMTRSPGTAATSADPDRGSDDASTPAGDVEASSEPAEPAAGPTRPTPPSDPRSTELVCADCAATWEAVNASLRPGDICPECRRGYLDERAVQ